MALEKAFTASGKRPSLKEGRQPSQPLPSAGLAARCASALATSFSTVSRRVRCEPADSGCEGSFRRAEPAVKSPGHQRDRQHGGRAQRPGATAPSGLPGALLLVGPDDTPGNLGTRLGGFRGGDQAPGRLALEFVKLIAIDFEVMARLGGRLRTAARQRQEDRQACNGSKQGDCDPEQHRAQSCPRRVERGAATRGYGISRPAAENGRGVPWPGPSDRAFFAHDKFQS